jgi:hypothetical protein
VLGRAQGSSRMAERKNKLDAFGAAARKPRYGFYNSCAG